MMEPIKRLNVGDSIINQIKDLFLDGKLKPGDKLPPERELMEMFEVGRTSLREALKVLEAQGLIVRSQRGTFISTNFNDFYTDSLIYQFYFSEVEWQDIFEARRFIEKELAGMAAQRATPADLAEMQQTIEDMKAAIAENNYALYISSNMQFHEKIAAASYNQVMVDLYNSISSLVLRAQKKAAAVPGVMNESLQFHQNIYRAIEQKDVEKARGLMENHIESVHGFFKKA
ncbi:FadR/GntR family transcriptional regulator [Planococcus sp. YIM B11945]|uniref:FadR/GntR family transcriptional regulator n=1 Tax=Planococcus sp. YIM B11945 TaxID=3435410 RepID=UPI003D7DA13F